MEIEFQGNRRCQVCATMFKVATNGRSYSRLTNIPRDNVSLIQFATEERIVLFHIAQYQGGKYLSCDRRYYRRRSSFIRIDDSIESLVAPTIKLIMEDPHTKKVGVAVLGMVVIMYMYKWNLTLTIVPPGDCTRLRKFLGIDSRSLFELSHLYRQVEAASTGVGAVSKRLVSLAWQVEEHLQLPLWKGEVRYSDWTKELKLQQIMCKRPSPIKTKLSAADDALDAASDSYAGLRLYDILEGKRKALKPTPPRPSFAELNKPIILPGGSAIRVCEDSVEEEELNPTTDSVEQRSGNIADDTERPKQGDPFTPFEDPSKKLGKPPQVLAAERWATQWRDGLPEPQKPKIARSCLRA